MKVPLTLSRRPAFLALAVLLAGCGGGGGSSSPSGPRITTAPRSQTVALGASATFAVAATGAGLTYQWRKGSTPIDGANGPSLVVSNVSAADAGSYYVLVTGGGKTVTSDGAVLAIQGAPRVVASPRSVATTAGSSATFSVAASGDAPLAYQWRRDGEPVGGAIDASYTVASVSAANVGNYDVVVSNPKGSVASSVAVLSIGTVTLATISGQPQSLTRAAGTSATFGVAASGTGPIAYRWQKNGVDLAGATDATFTVDAASPSDAGSYRVVVTNPAGDVTSDAAALTVVVPPTLTTQPADATVNPGQPASFSVAATGGGLSFQWTKGGVDIAGATGSSYAIASATASDAGSFAVRATNAAGTVTSDAATLTVRTPPAIVQQPRIVVNAGSTSLVVVADGSAPLSYQWYRNGLAVSGANAATLVLGTVNSGNRGTYRVVVSNVVTSVTSDTVNVQ